MKCHNNKDAIKTLVFKIEIDAASSMAFYIARVSVLRKAIIKPIYAPSFKSIVIV